MTNTDYIEIVFENSQASKTKINVTFSFKELFYPNLQTGPSGPSWQLPELKQYPGEHFSVIRS